MTKTMNRILAAVGLAVVFALVCGLALACMGVQGVAEARESYFSSEGGEWEDGVFTEYSTGLYWYASGNPIPRRTNPVDKTKPTLIFAHGWKQNEGYQQRDLWSLWGGTNSEFHSKHFDDFEFETEFYQTLIDLGYNVGQFYWSQLSDDYVTCDEKIWSSNGQFGMRYVLNDGAGHRVDGDPSLNPTKSVAMIFGDAIREALGDDYAKDLHLVGHSMGGQLVLATGEYITLQHDAGNFGEHLVPTQVTLLDPYMTFNILSEGATVDHLGGKSFSEEKPIVSLCADAMETLARHDIAIDVYATVFYRMYPMIMDEDEAAAMTDRLARYTVWTYLQGFSKFDNPAAKHCMSIDYYFSTMYEETIAKDNYGVEVPSAKASAEYILSLRGKAFTQSLAEDKQGENPFYMHNSAYTRTNAEYEPVSDEYTAFVPFAKCDDNKNLPLVIGLSVGLGGAAVIAAVVVVLVVLKKKKVQQ